jgi:hypothetical protein
MHVLETIKLSFDPKESNDEVKKIFENETSKILWCCIKSGHITSQYFNNTIIKVTQTISDKKPENYKDFLGCIAPLTNNFGRICVSESQFGGSDYEIDHEFWSDIFNFINHKKFFEVQIKNLNKTVETV